MTSSQENDKKLGGYQFVKECRSEQQGGCRAAPKYKEEANNQDSTEQSRMGSSNGEGLPSAAEQSAE